MTASEWPFDVQVDPLLSAQALAGLTKIAVEAGVWEQTWHAQDMTEVCEMIAARYRYQREQLSELTAEVARLKAEADLKAADHNTIHVTSLNISMAMVICKDEEPGTVLRETDGLRRDYVLGEDRQWTART